MTVLERAITFADLPLTNVQIAASAQPSAFANTTSLATAFSGDMSKVAMSTGKLITGAATLEQPSSGYAIRPENAVIFTYLESSSGFDGGGRTGAAAHYVIARNIGQGDLCCYYAIGSVTGSNPGATSFLDNPASVLFVGQASGHTDGVYLNPVEIHNLDNGNDVAAINYVASQARTNDTGALGAVWYGFRSQNSGSKAIDAHFSADGPSKIGIDLSKLATNDSGTWTNVAIALAGNDRIYFNATPSASPGYASSPGSTYFQYSTGNTGVQLVVNSASAYLFTTSSAFLYAATTTFAQNSNNKLQVVGAATGFAPEIKITASADTNQDLKITALGTGNIRFNNAGSFSANGAVATALSSVGPTGSHTTVQEWLTIKNASGVVRYVPCF